MEQEYKTNNSFVAFIDVLGSSEAIKNDPDKSLNAIHKAYDMAIDKFNRYENGNFNELKINIFSDNIILSCPVKEGEEVEALVSILFFSMLLQVCMWINGLMVRGGIAFGDYFADGIMVWGKALLRAYELESKIAIYPRIIVMPEIVDILNCFSSPIFKSFVCEDYDGIFFIDPLGNKKIGDEFLDFIDQLIEDNTERMSKYKDNLRVYQKVNWLQQYFCEKYDRIKERSHNGV